MKVKIAFSQEKEISKIISDLKNQIGSYDAKLIQFYASSTINPEKISEQIYNSFGKVPTIGCSTSGEIISGQMLDNSIVMMAIGAEIIEDCKIEILTDISTDASVVHKAFDSFSTHYKESMATLNPEKYVGIVLIDGLSGKEELINERIGDLTNITFIGGSAGDDLKFEKTYLYANGKSYTNAAILAVIKTNTQFDIIKTQSFKSANKKLIITKAEESTRTVIEINGNPAVAEYAALTGTEKNTISKVFSNHPIGLAYQDDFFVRSPQRTDGDKIVFYCSVKEGMELELLESQNIIEQTQKDLQAKIDTFGSISAIINFNCILRTLELKDKKQTVAYGKLFSDIPTIGFSTYGESYISHINQTATLLIFK